MRVALAALGLLAFACGDGSGTGAADLGADVVTVDMVDPDDPDAGDVGVTELGPDMVEEMCIDPGGTLGVACFRSSECGDSCFCNGAELCRDGVCVAGDPPCDDDIECTVHTCDEAANRCGEVELRDELCDDENVCTGDEICDPVLGCIYGIPLNCSDGDSCTVDQCDRELGCLNPLRDLDGDGFPALPCTSSPEGDCRDDRADINPGTAEVCDNFEDDDCDGLADVLDPDCAPPNDACSTAIELAGSGFFGFGTTGLMDDYETQCELRGDPLDAVFFFDVLVESDLTVEIAAGPDDAVLELRGPGDLGVCADDAQASADGVPCARSNLSGAPEPARIEQEGLAPGRYYLLVETEAEDVGTLEFRLTNALPPPLTDNCLTAPTIIAPGGVFTENVLLLGDEYDAPSCGSSRSQPEACYVLDLAAPQDVILSAEFFSSSGRRGPGAITVVDDFGDVVGTERGCASGSAPVLVLRSLSAGAYYILVERTSSSVYSHRLEVEYPYGFLQPCGYCFNACTAAPSAFGSPRTVDLSLAVLDEPSLGCALPAGAQNDSFFTFDTTVAGELVGLEIGAPGIFAYSIDDASGTCPATSAPICQFGGVLGAVSTTVSVPDVGTHNLAIQTGVGTGNLTVEIDPTGAAAP